MAAADGITHMVATPHANDRFVYDRPYLSGLLARLQQLAGDTPQLTLGCDFHLSYDNLQNALDRPHSFTIGDTRYLLVELSNYSVPLQISDCFIKLGDCGITPILTHPERNPILQQAPQRVLEWAEQGCLVQVTASARQDFRDIPLRLGPRVDPVDRQAGHDTIDDESNVSCGIGRAEVDGMPPLGQSHRDGGSNRRLSDASFAHDHDEAVLVLRDVIDQPLQARQVNRFCA